MSIPLFIPTFNRAAQCDLLLRSIAINLPNLFLANVFMKAGNIFTKGVNRTYDQAYGQLVMKHENVDFYTEFDLLVQLYEFLETNAGGLVAFAMDDCLAYRKSGITEDKIQEFFTDKRVWAVNLRLGLNTVVQDYLTGSRQEKIGQYEDVGEGFIKYDYAQHHALTNYGFGFSWDGVCYRASDLLRVWNKSDFTLVDNPHSILFQRVENYMTNRRSEYSEAQPLMVCPKESIFFCQNINATHGNCTTGQRFNAPLDQLNKLYLEDYNIDLSTMDVSHIVSCHAEIPFQMTKESL